MDIQDMQELFQPQQMNPQLERYLVISIPSRDKRRKLQEQQKQKEEAAAEAWDRLGDFA